MFKKLVSFRVSPDGGIDRTLTELPAVAVSAGVRASMPADMNTREAVHLLRRLADEIEAAASRRTDG